MDSNAQLDCCTRFLQLMLADSLGSKLFALSLACKLHEQQIRTSLSRHFDSGVAKEVVCFPTITLSAIN
jgi:hypothetical protein